MSLFKRNNRFEYVVYVFCCEKRIRTIMNRTQDSNLYTIVHEWFDGCMSGDDYSFMSVTAGYEPDKHRCYHLLFNDVELDRVIGALKEETDIPIERCLIVRECYEYYDEEIHCTPEPHYGIEPPRDRLGYGSMTPSDAVKYINRVLSINSDKTYADAVKCECSCDRSVNLNDEYEVRLTKIKNSTILCFM